MVDCGGALTFVLGRHDGCLEDFLGSKKMCVLYFGVSLWQVAGGNRAGAVV